MALFTQLFLHVHPYLYSEVSPRLQCRSERFSSEQKRHIVPDTNCGIQWCVRGNSVSKSMLPQETAKVN